MTEAVPIECSPDIAELAKALPAAQSAIAKITTDALNTHFGNRYATLCEITDAIVPAMNAAGFSVLQPCTSDGAAVFVTTRLMHTSAQWLQSTHRVPVSKVDAQGVGSATTYARRQALAALLAVAPQGEDDDGEGSVGRGAGRPPLPPTEPERPSRAKRVEALEARLGSVKTLRDLDRGMQLGKELRDELAAEEPETAARIDALYERRHGELIGGAG